MTERSELKLTMAQADALKKGVSDHLGIIPLNTRRDVRDRLAASGYINMGIVTDLGRSALSAHQKGTGNG